MHSNDVPIIDNTEIQQGQFITQQIDNKYYIIT